MPLNEQQELPVVQEKNSEIKIPRWLFWMPALIFLFISFVVGIVFIADPGPDFLQCALEYESIREKEISPLLDQCKGINRCIKSANDLDTTCTELAIEYFRKMKSGESRDYLYKRMLHEMKSLSDTHSEITAWLNSQLLRTTELKLEKQFNYMKDLISRMKSRAAKENRMSDLPPESEYDPRAMRKELTRLLKVMSDSHSLLWKMLPQAQQMAYGQENL